MLNEKKFKVTFLLDKTNLWIEKYLKNYNFKLNKKYLINIQKNPNRIKGQDLIFPMDYTKILSDNFLKRNKFVAITHASKLTRDRGFAPVQYQVLKNKKKIYISIIKATNQVDTGLLYMRDSFMLNGNELSDEIRFKTATSTFKIIKKFLTKYPNIKSIKKIKGGNFNKRRRATDSELNINKSIKSQFNLLRTCDNFLYPSFFKLKKKIYILKIYKSK